MSILVLVASDLYYFWRQSCLCFIFQVERSHSLFVCVHVYIVNCAFLNCKYVKVQMELQAC